MASSRGPVDGGDPHASAVLPAMRQFQLALGRLGLDLNEVEKAAGRHLGTTSPDSFCLFLFESNSIACCCCSLSTMFV